MCIDTIHKDTEKSVSHLPDPDNSVGNEDKKNNNRLNKGGGCLLSLLKQSQHLYEHTEHRSSAEFFKDSLLWNRCLNGC